MTTQLKFVLQNRHPPKEKSVTGPQILQCSMPCPAGNNFAEELAKSGYTPSAIVDFLRDYARAATEIGDDFLIVYPVEVPEVSGVLIV